MTFSASALQIPRTGESVSTGHALSICMTGCNSFVASWMPTPSSVSIHRAPHPVRSPRGNGGEGGKEWIHAGRAMLPFAAHVADTTIPLEDN